MGLSKPIIMANSSIDISNLATKTDITSLATKTDINSLAGLIGVKRVQTLDIVANFVTYSKDITIDSVNVSKSIVIKGVTYYSPDCYHALPDSDYQMEAILASNTSLRVMKRTTNSTDNYKTRFYVIEFY